MNTYWNPEGQELTVPITSMVVETVEQLGITRIKVTDEFIPPIDYNNPVIQKKKEEKTSKTKKKNLFFSNNEDDEEIGKDTQGQPAGNSGVNSGTTTVQQQQQLDKEDNFQKYFENYDLNSSVKRSRIYLYVGDAKGLIHVWHLTDIFN